ncbi:DUF1598 domain-containing protein [Fuerstiella marisgermanici]|uniref:Uncharacterized protein n=1 Tax=Fuerstiella marisgermanici TaxID=1891926 RepID=A0A1P8WRM5_9PLAN|nr:DUF1598 domain-containing protein [Fuerstiella marisgermanici]APZ96716.1 hypothetical protein Fuma_06389 [Fuerstiella marisgermanici]
MLRKSFLLLTFASVALCLTTVSRAADKSAASAVNASDLLSAQKLKLQARVAAEQGDFTTAAKLIADAADLTGDVRTARTARHASSPQPAGGNQFANFQELIQLIVDQTMNADQDNWGATVGGQGLPGGSISVASNGVFFAVNALANVVATGQSKSNMMQAAEFAKTANHNLDVRSNSELRMVSLPRLEKLVQRLVQEGRPIPEDVRTIAGISRIEYLFVFPETQDVVIAGPAGDWHMAANGRAISSANGRPTLNLDDVVTLTQTFSQNGAQFFMCTINPKQEQVAAVQDYVTKNRRGLNPRTADAFTNDVEQKLGLQNVITQGIPHNSRVASVIVDADYRMKEIGIGKRQGPNGMKSYFDLLSRSEQRGTGSMDALRWWMAVGYDAINMSPDGQVFEFSGNSVRCLSENQIVDNNGTRQSTGKADRANAKFAELFTKHLPELAAQDPVFADLENVFDLAMVSALIHGQGIAQQVGWHPVAFSRNGSFQTQPVEVPNELMTAAAHRIYDGRNIVIQVAGGVRVDVAELVSDKNRIKNVPELADRTNQATPIGQQNARWWWDASQR